MNARNYTRLINRLGGRWFFTTTMLLFLVHLMLTVFGPRWFYDNMNETQLGILLFMFLLSQMPWRKAPTVIHRLKSVHN